MDFANESIFSHGKTIDRARKAAHRHNKELTDAGYSEDDFIQEYCKKLLLSQKSYDALKGNRDQFNAAALKNFLKEINREKINRWKRFSSSSADEIIGNLEGWVNDDSANTETDTGILPFVSGKTKESALNHLKFDEITHLRGLSRIEARSDIDLAHKVFGEKSLAFRIFVYRYFAPRTVKRTELAEVFDTKVEAIRWAEGKLTHAAPIFDVHQPSEHEKACLHHPSAKSNRRYCEDSRRKLILTTEYRH